jgi:hypothetical protein
MELRNNEEAQVTKLESMWCASCALICRFAYTSTGSGHLKPEADQEHGRSRGRKNVVGDILKHQLKPYAPEKRPKSFLRSSFNRGLKTADRIELGSSTGGSFSFAINIQGR